MADNTDLFISFQFDINNNKIVSLKTNIKKDQIQDILDCWIGSQICKGKDISPANILDVYTIRIDVDLSDDSFMVTSDTGNAGLTLGIILHLTDNLLDKWLEENEI